jgi:hypothetical protein
MYADRKGEIEPYISVVHRVIQMQGMTRELFNDFLVNTALLNDDETHFLIFDATP